MPPIPLYARHIGQLNVLTYLIRHRDSNQGNFLIGKAERGARVFSIDHGVAFASEESDRGDVWKDMRVNRLPADTVERLRKITPEIADRAPGRARAMAARRTATTFPWRTAGTSRKTAASAVKGDDLQMGLNKSEIRAIAPAADASSSSASIAARSRLVPAPGA